MSYTMYVNPWHLANSLVDGQKHQQPGMEAAAFGELLYLALGMAYHREESYRALSTFLPAWLDV